MIPLRKSLHILLLVLSYTATSYTQVDSSLGFYPLHIGDYWEYSSVWIDYYYGLRGYYSYHVSITGDTTLANGKQYFIVEHSSEPFGRPDQPRFQRVDSVTSQVFAFDSSNGDKEYLIDSLRASPGSAFNGCRLPSIQSTTVYSIDTSDYFGNLLVSRNYTTPFNVGPFIQYTLTIPIGLTFTRVGTSGPDPYTLQYSTDTLVYAKINGKEYGTSVSVPQKSTILANFKLGQNYPNPFNPTTSIDYQLSARSDVTLKVYNLLGQEVSTLVDQKQEAGNYQVKFSGTRLPSGVYFYRLNAGMFSETKKLMLLK